jgi:hypothetical protein
MIACASWAPRRRAPRMEANQPAWRAAALAEEAGPVLRAFVGARPAEPCLRLLKGRKDKIKIHRKMAETRVPSDTYPLRGKANRAYGETSRPRSPQTLPRVGQRPTSTPPPPRTPEAPGGGLPGQCHDSRGNNFPHGWHGHLLSGGMRVGLTPRSDPNYLGQGVKYPLGPPPLLGPGPWRPGPKHWWCQPTWRLS